MDITQLFKASVKTARLRNKSLPAPDKNRILARSGNRSEFAIKTKDICHQISQLRNLLLENRAAYMRFGYHLKSAVQMSDAERDIIDEESEKILTICTQFIGDLRGECSRMNLSKQATNHMEAVLELLADYLRAVYRIYTQQKEYRVRHELDTYKLLKLESNKKLIPVKPGRERVRIELPIPDRYTELEEDEATEEDNEDDDLILANGHTDRKGQTGSKRAVGKNRERQPRTYTRSITVEEDSGNSLDTNQDTLSAEDIQMFESENHQLYNELKGLSDEVEQIEKNVVDIAKLQDIFTEKVTMQHSDIERIANTVVGSTENVKDANEQIKQAIQRNAGLRVYILFFLLVMSFSLLFLDWYND